MDEIIKVDPELAEIKIGRTYQAVYFGEAGNKEIIHDCTTMDRPCHYSKNLKMWFDHNNSSAKYCSQCGKKLPEAEDIKKVLGNII